MKFNRDDKSNLPFSVEFKRKKNPSNNFNNNSIKINEIEKKSQDMENNILHLKESLEKESSKPETSTKVNPLKLAFQQKEVVRLEAEAIAKKKLQEAQNQKLLYEKYKKQREEQNKQNYQNNFNKNTNFSENKRTITAPRFQNQFNSTDSNINLQGNYQSNRNNTGGYQGNNTGSGYQGNRNNTGGYQGNNTGSGYQGNRNNTGGGYQGNRLNTGGFVDPRKTFLQNNIQKMLAKSSFSPAIKPVRSFGGPSPFVKKKKVLGSVEDFDWRKHLNNDNEITSLNKKSKSKNKFKNKEKDLLKKNITITQDMNLTSLSKLISVPLDFLTKQAKKLDISEDVHKILDKDALFLILDMNGFNCNFYGTEEHFSEFMKINEEECTKVRPPVICVVGHVDHGKTSFLDNIRKSNVADKEAGGITQNISLWQLEKYGRAIFIDTPGHSVFSIMRKVSLNLTDMVILLIAADDGIKDQTIEIMKVISNERKTKEIKVILGITKIDKIEKNKFDKTLNNIYSEMTKYDLVPFEYEGDIKTFLISNKTGEGISELLSYVEELKKDNNLLKYNEKRGGIGTIVNSYMEKGVGIIAYVLLKQGEIKIGDKFIYGKNSGKIRLILEPKNAKTVNCENIIKITGFGDEMPNSGDDFIVVNDDNLMKNILLMRNKILEETPQKEFDLSNKEKVNILLKTDTVTSLESLKQMLLKLTNKVIIEIFSTGVGNVTLADAEKAYEFNLVIIGFNTKIDGDAKNYIKNKDIKLINENIIYRIEEEVELLTKKTEEVTIETLVGSCEVRHLFTFNNIVIAGSKVLSGSIFHSINHVCEIFNKNVSVFKGTISSMKKDKDNVKEGKIGTDVGIIFDNFNKLEIGYIIKCYKVSVETKIIE
jgi:translation initiation factor IF-2